MKNRHKRKRIIFIGSVFLISISALFFVVSNFRSNIVFFYSPSELVSTNSNKFYNKKIRVGGLVKEGGIKKIDALTTKFFITDLSEDLEIYYSGLLPDLFREKQGVVAEGKFDKEKNQFFAEELLIKHDEKYMPPEITNSLSK